LFELTGNFKLWYNLISEVDTKIHSLVHLPVIHIIVFLLNGKVINGVPWGLILGSLFLLIYFNEVHKITDNDRKDVFFADNTRIIVTTSNQEGAQTVQPKHSLIKSNGLKPIFYCSNLIKRIV